MRKIETLEDAQYFIDHLREIGRESPMSYNHHSFRYERHCPDENGNLVVDDTPVILYIDRHDEMSRYCFTNEVGKAVKEYVPLTVKDIYNDRKYINYALSLKEEKSKILK